MLKVTFASIGDLLTNCYIATDAETGESLAVDCADFNDDFKRLLERAGAKELKYILLTHGHFDHIGGAAALKSYAGGQVCIHKKDEICLSSEERSLSSSMGGKPFTPVGADVLFNGGEKFLLGATEFKVLHTPGHTPGSVCYLTDGVIFSGDTLFKDSAGRIDLLGGEAGALMRSMAKIAAIEEDRIVYPGHGEHTTLNREKMFNGFIVSVL